jgi:hypothetical protein
VSIRHHDHVSGSDIYLAGAWNDDGGAQCFALCVRLIEYAQVIRDLRIIPCIAQGGSEQWEQNKFLQLLLPRLDSVPLVLALRVYGYYIFATPAARRIVNRYPCTNRECTFLLSSNAILAEVTENTDSELETLPQTRPQKTVCNQNHHNRKHQQSDNPRRQSILDERRFSEDRRSCQFGSKSQIGSSQHRLGSLTALSSTWHLPPLPIPDRWDTVRRTTTGGRRGLTREVPAVLTSHGTSRTPQ